MCVLALVCAGALPAGAQDVPAPDAGTVALEIVDGPVAAIAIVHPPERPSILIPLYVSAAGLEGLDYLTTRRAIASGAAAEGNPVMKSVVGNSAAFLAVKAGSIGGTIWLEERLWRSHRMAAVASMIGFNVAMSAVVGHNARVLAQIR